MLKRLVITGGGTGGHLFPGIAVADAVLKRSRDAQVMFIGAGRPVDQRVLAGKPYQMASIPCGGIKGMSILSRIRALFKLLRGVFVARGLLRSFRPQLVLGVGGYVTGPVLLAARTLGIKTAIHEQNALPGLANRWAGRFVDRIFVSLPQARHSFAGEKTVLTGNPLREELLEAAARPKEVPQSPPTLLVLGGSQGAHRVNELACDAVALLAARGIEWRAIHQTGKADRDWVAGRYSTAGIVARVVDFIDDMAGVYQNAHLVVSRGGATTLAELALFGLPAVLVPYPFAADNHQVENAKFLVEAGAARMAREEELTGERLADLLQEFWQDRALLARMSAAAKKLAMPRATETIVSECERLALAA